MSCPHGHYVIVLYNIHIPDPNKYIMFTHIDKHQILLTIYILTIYKNIIVRVSIQSVGHDPHSLLLLVRKHVFKRKQVQITLLSRRG